MKHNPNNPIYLSIYLCICILLLGCTESRQMAAEHYRHGIAFEKAGDYEKAIIEFQNAIKYHAEYIEANIAYQNLKISAGDKENLLLEYKKKLDLQPESPTYNFLYGRIMDKTAERITYYEKALKQDPNFLWAINSLGNEYLKQGDTQAAVKQMKKVIEIDSEFAPVHLSLARAWYLIGRYEYAMSEIKKYLSLQPDSYEGYEELGKIQFASDENQKAFEAWDKATEINPNRVSSMVLAGNAHFSLRDLKSAKRLADKALEVSPASIPAKLLQAEVFFTENKTSESASLLSQILRKEPSNIKALELKATILLGKNQTEQAKEIYKQILGIYSRHEVSLYALGMIYYKENKIEESVEYLTRLALIDPSKTDVLRIIRDYSSLNGDLGKAKKWSEQVCENKDVNYNDYLQNGLILWNSIERTKANKFFYDAFSKDPVDTDLLLLMFLTAENNNQNSLIMAEFIKLSSQTSINDLKELYKQAGEVMSRNYTNTVKKYNLSNGKKSKDIELFLALWSFYKQHDNEKSVKILNSLNKREIQNNNLAQVFEIMKSKVTGNKKNATANIKMLTELNKSITSFPVKCFNELELARLNIMLGKKAQASIHVSIANSLRYNPTEIIVDKKDH